MAERKRSNLFPRSNEDLDRDYPAKEHERDTQGDVRVGGTDRRRDGGDTPNPTSQPGAEDELDDEDELDEEEE